MDLERIRELGFETISTWYTFVLVLSFSFWWNIFVVLMSFAIFLLTTSIFAFRLDIPNVALILYASDTCYLLDVVFTISYLRNKRLRKLKFASCRHWIFIVVDLISVLPIELMFTFHYVTDYRNPVVRALVAQNRSLRVYRVLLMEWLYMPSIRTPWKYVLFTFVLFFAKTLILGHLFTCVWYNVRKGVSCDEKKFNCYLWHEVNMLNVIMLNWTGPEAMFSEVSERIILVCAMTIGFFCIYTYIYPYTLYFSILTGFRHSNVAEKRKRLSKFLKNMIQKDDLKQKIVHYFNYLWEEGEEDEELEFLMRNIPLALQKEVLTDIYWETFRHSYLLRGASRSFKRSLSLVMTTEYHHDGEVVFYKGQAKQKMIFLVQGVLQVMAEENESSPLLSFSSGTVFGELSLFLLTESQALVKCKGSCELQILSCRKILSALMEYPKDRKLIFRKFNEKILMARNTQWRKKRFKEDQQLEMLTTDTSYFNVVNCVKWLKRQWRHCWAGHKRHLDVIRAKEEGTRLPSWRVPLRPEIRAEYISNFLDLVVLSDILEEKKGFVCLRSKPPYSIDPDAQFLHIWKYILLVMSLIPALVYPVCTSWFDIFPFPVYLISYVVTLVYQVDVGLKLITAVKTKHSTISKFGDVFRHNFKKVTFYLDVIAALPYQFYILTEYDVMSEDAYKIGLLLHPAIAKSYVFFKLKAPLGNYVSLITLLKNCLVYFLLLYWLCDIIQLHSVYNIIPANNDWMDRYLVIFPENREFLRRNLLSVFRAFVTAISVPSNTIYSDDNTDLVLTCLVRYLFFVFSCYFMGSCYSSIVVKRFGSETFRILVKRLKNYLASKNVPQKIVERTVRSIEFQWKYDKASYITSNMSILSEMTDNIRRLTFLETTYKALEASPLFHEESPEYILEVLENSDSVAVPPGLVLVTYGHSSHILTVINRGFCQLNSHLEKDVVSNVGRPIILGPSCAFPLLSSFCNVPAPISVVTITDCELVVIDLNKLIGIMLKYKIFKDIVEVMQETNISAKLSSRPALMKICAFENTDATSDVIMRDYGRIKQCLYVCWRNFVYFMHTTFPKSWSYFYMVYLLIDCICWPSCFGLFLFQSHIIMPMLIVGKLIVFINMIIHIFFPYYNKNGLSVTHPLYTMLNYLSSTFILDVILIIPIFEVYYYGFADPYEKPNIYLTIVGVAQRFVSLVYIVGCIGHIGASFNETYYTTLVQLWVSFAVVFHLHVNLCMFLFSKWTFGGPHKIIAFEVIQKHRPVSEDILRENNVADYYLYLSYWIINTLTTNQYMLQQPRGLLLYLSYAHGFTGTVISYYMFVTVSSGSKLANMRGANFREQFTSLMKYLNYEKTEDKTIDRVKVYYKHLWSQTGGENIKEIFGRLPLYLLEELWYPLYRPTFVKNSLFEKADEGFFRILSTHVKSVFFTRGSLVIFKNETQHYIYFLHKGKCFVYDWFLVLDMGSIVGDVHQTGLMQNRVYALTHVEMLKISSNVFFTIINNFDGLEANFIYAVKRAESFLKSDVYREYNPLHPVDSRDAVNAFELKNRDIGFEDESHFEDPENITRDTFQTTKYKPNERHPRVIYPHSWTMVVYTYIGFVDILLTALSIPAFFMFGGLSIVAFIFIGILDFIWLVIVITTFFVSLLDKEKGDVITKHKYIAKKYFNTAFFFDIISLIPFDLLPVAWARSRSGANASAVSLLRAVRYARVYSFYQFRELELGLMKNESAKKCLFNFMLFLWSVILVTAIFVKITSNPRIVAARNNLNFKREQSEALLDALLYVINFLTSANAYCFGPSTRSELLHFNCSVVWLLVLKGNLISNILSLIYFRNLSTFNYKTKVSKLESFLQKKEASPILIKSVINYQMNLFRFSRSESMPSLLVQMPMIIRIQVMKDLFGHHVHNFPLFRGLDSIFLDQLIARAKKEVYFPGEKIVEQGDVDHRLYFIHTGEVYIINQTKKRAYVEYVVGRMYSGEYFGEAQGLWFVKPHIYTYRGRTLVEIIVLHSNDWMDLRKTFPKMTMKIYERAREMRYI